MSEAGIHGEWLSLLDVSGPFLALPVLKEAMPQGLAGLDTDTRKIARQAYAEWSEAFETEDEDRARIHDAWIELVLGTVLSYRDPTADFLKNGDGWNHYDAEHDVTLTPDYVLTDGQDKPLLLVAKYPQEISLEISSRSDRWAASPIERMVELCRATGVRLGLVTNGELWALVDAGTGVTSVASWYARLWSQEPLTLQAFVDLLGIRRFFAGEGAALAGLLDKSLSLQDEVTDALGEQVRRAVEVLVQSLDRADQDRNRELLKDVTPAELYEAGLTIMMRIVFLLSAEERGLLLMGDETYEANYAVSTLRLQLRSEAEEILERRWDAWSRLLSLFRAVFAGIDHDALRLPALGGSLFDPDRFPFLEGRAKGSKWATDAAVPLPIDNRTVLLLLEAVQLFQGRALSYLALDVEQIGYVYEGLLERTVVRAAEPTLDLAATKNAVNPWVTLAELDDAAAKVDATVQELLKERTGSSSSRIKNALAEPLDEASTTKLLAACQADHDLKNRIAPYFHLLRTDSWGYPLVYPKGTFMVASGSDRRETGTHYTPKSFTESIVKTTLEPIVYDGPAQGAEVKDWKLKTPGELLDLKICDPAMGSGAFLVQACRYLGERLLESWCEAETVGKTVSSSGEVVEEVRGLEPMSKNAEERLTTAKRLIAERCLYGVDKNPLAVELAKLSIWLVTLAKGRPFGFLDHNIKCGDSLIGLRQLEQVHLLEIIPKKDSAKKLFAHDIDTYVAKALELRTSLRRRVILDISDVEIMARLDSEARALLQLPVSIANLIVKSGMAGGLAKYSSEKLSFEVADLLRSTNKDHDRDARDERELPFHWPLEFPEVFLRPNPGFDSLIGNPPFMGGRKISSSLGAEYSRYIKETLLPGAKGSINLVMFFLLQGAYLSRASGTFGFIATDTVAESDTREVGLVKLFELATLYNATPSLPWPGAANVRIAILQMFKGRWDGVVFLAGERVETISTMLQPGPDFLRPAPLTWNAGRCSDGVKVQGAGFVIDAAEAARLLRSSENRAYLSRYIVGDDINHHIEQLSNRWVINFWDRPESECSRIQDLWNILVERVKPYRDGLTKQVHEKCFWKFWDRREEFFNRVRKKRSVLVLSKLSKYITLAYGDPSDIYSEKVKVFDLASYSAFAVLQSSFHELWAHLWGSSTGETPAYVGSTCFDTFPFPEPFYRNNGLTDCELGDLDEVGCRLYKHRQQIGAARQIGLTDIYNLFHRSICNDADIEGLRALHCELDEAVARRYGWTDLDFKRAFRTIDDFDEPEEQYVLSDDVARQVLMRLTALNRQVDASVDRTGKSDTKSKRAQAVLPNI